MARFRSFEDAVAFYERERGMTRKRAIERAMKRCPSLVKKMGEKAVADAEPMRRRANIQRMLAEMRDEAVSKQSLGNALAAIRAERERREKQGTM